MHLASLYMALRVVRLLVYIGIILVYIFAVNIEVKRFVLLATALYFVYLLLDTLFLTSTEKRMKKS
jgi:uncharacterized protein (DUF58 family)